MKVHDAAGTDGGGISASAHMNDLWRRSGSGWVNEAVTHCLRRGGGQRPAMSIVTKRASSATFHAALLLVITPAQATVKKGPPDKAPLAHARRLVAPKRNNLQTKVPTVELDCTVLHLATRALGTLFACASISAPSLSPSFTTKQIKRHIVQPCHTSW
jgi:hypothetical protein